MQFLLQQAQAENMVNFEGWTKPGVIGAGAAPRVGGYGVHAAKIA